MSNFFFSHIVFYPFGELSVFSSNLTLSSAYSFSLEESEICCLGKSIPLIYVLVPSYFQQIIQCCFYSSNTGKQWIEVDFQTPKILSGILTQGVSGTERWASSFYISTSIDGLTFVPYAETVGGQPKVFEGNSDPNSIVRNMLDRNIEARFVRITIIEGGPGGKGLRFNLIGCFT